MGRERMGREIGVEMGGGDGWRAGDLNVKMQLVLQEVSLKDNSSGSAVLYVRKG